MARLLVQVEGQTEQRFVRGILRDHLSAGGYHLVDARGVGKQFGICSWPLALKGIVSHLKEDSGRIVSTMVDFYGLPAAGGRAWPGREMANQLRSAAEKAECVRDAMREAVLAQTGDARRFVPFVMMHEFEALLFSDCPAFARAIGRTDLAEKFANIRTAVETPEDINDSPLTAPSKQILDLFGGYQKPRHGEDASREIGLTRMREQCPLFDSWVTEIEARAEL